MGASAGHTDYDYWLDALRDGRAFIKGTVLAASVGNFSEIQLLNPAGSGVNAVVFNLIAHDDLSANIQIRRHDAALATLVGAGVNLNIGGAAGACVLRTATPAALDGTLLTVYNSNNSLNATRFQWWVCELAPGVGVIGTPDIVNDEMSAEFRWIEIPA